MEQSIHPKTVGAMVTIGRSVSLRLKSSFVGLRAALSICTLAVLVTSMHATTTTVLYNFNPSQQAGHPGSALIRDAAGNFYGTTTDGGTYGLGTVFKLTPAANGAWNSTILHSFNNDGVDGYSPVDRLFIDAAGNLYGITTYGGPSPGNCAPTCGTVYELSPPAAGQTDWTERILYDLNTGADHDVIWPTIGLTSDSAGNVYGVGHGPRECCGFIFKMFPNSSGPWGLGIIYRFCSLVNCADGNGPNSRLIADAAGNLYGTTYTGGAYNQGTVFKLTPPSAGQTDWTETVLYSFQGDADGFTPLGVALDSLGNLYGTTQGGGTNLKGTAFELAAGTWTKTTLFNFIPTSGGGNPWTLIVGPGVLYGTASAGLNGCGEAFELIPSAGAWTETVLHTFDVTGGCQPEGLISDRLGNLYGTTNRGGAYNYGTFFEITQANQPSLNLHLVASPTPPTPGALMTYTFKVWNQSTVNAVHEVLTTQVPAGTTFSSIALSGTAGLGSCTTPVVGASGPVVCHENSVMRPGSTWTIRLTVQITAPVGTVLTESATASADNLASTTATIHNTVH